MSDQLPVPPKQAWIAFLLTTGEFAIAIFLLIHDGHILAFYLATTYVVRETAGGKEYHIIVVRLFKGAVSHLRRK